MLKWLIRRQMRQAHRSHEAGLGPIRLEHRQDVKGHEEAFASLKNHHDPLPTAMPPMPGEDELNEQFDKVVSELDLSADKRDIMMGLPADKKWQIIVSNQSKMTGEPVGEDMSEDQVLGAITKHQEGMPSDEMDEITVYSKSVEVRMRALKGRRRVLMLQAEIDSLISNALIEEADL